MTETFCKLTHEIMRATHWISKTTGELFKLTGTQKIIWVHMTSRYEFFRSLGKEWFDDQEDIAKDTGCDVSTVKGFIKLLVEHGYMAVERKKLRGYVYSNSYRIIASLESHNKHASTAVSAQSLDRGEGSVMASVVITPSESTVAPQGLTGPIFEDVPLEAYIDMPPKASVVVHETLRGFADTLDEEIKFDAPVLPKGLTDSEPDLWGNV
ncbi:DUF6945 domain-containing protein [Pseudomonas halotolerans]|uniref:DUF6945 domain-containing protein n=1 Tax=Pseudomonas halotolerans TaxID=3143552 RepID=UPI0031DDA8DB